MPIDSELLVRKIRLIEEDLKRLFEYRKKQDRMAAMASERLFERIIGRMIDINFHLVVETKNVVPKTYYESFMLLGEMEILTQRFAQELASLSGLRNRLAHEYNEIDEDQVRKALRIYPALILKYIKVIMKFIKAKRQ